MAAVDPPAGLMDIASTLSQDDIPMKLRCAICNMLAINAFRLPCCDQSICESCQSSLVDTCPVCAHSPVSPDLCKPNKALRTTLKAYLRTEEKKREKDRQAAAASTPTIPTPAESENPTTDAPVDQVATEPTPAETPEVNTAQGTAFDEPMRGAEAAETTESAVEDTTLDPQNSTDQPNEATGDQVVDQSNHVDADAPPTDGDIPISDEVTQEMPQAEPTAMNMNGGFSGMGWNGNGNFNGMNPFMGNPMFNFPNQMSMTMGMDPMANQGMFGDYGMNMTGMGMNGMNFEGQGMYGSLGWDSQQNMWQGGQDKFNPNAFANGSGPPYGGAFGGSNMSYPNDFQSGYNGPGYGRGGFRGRGRGNFYGPGRGGYGGHGQGHYGHANHGLPNRPISSASAGPNVAMDPEAPQNSENNGATDAIATDGNDAVSADPASANDQQPQGIPTIDSLDQALPNGPGGYQGPMGPGYGRGGYSHMRGSMVNGRGGYWGGHMSQSHIEPRNPGVEGAPAAPRAMRQGLPNTSVLRQRGFHQGRPSISNSMGGPTKSNPDTPTLTRASSGAPSQPPRAGSRSRSPSQHQASRAQSPSAPAADDDRESRRDRDVKRLAERRTHSPSAASSRRSSRPRHNDSDRERRSGHRSHRSRRHHSRSRSRSANRRSDSRQPDRLTAVAQDEPNGHSRSSSGKINPRDLASRIGNSHRTSRDRPSRREQDRERDRPRDSRRGDHDKDRARDRRDRDRGDRTERADRDSERDRDRDRDRRRDRDRDRERDRDRGGRDRERDRKRSRRDRSESANASDHSSYPRARRVRRETDDRNDRDAPSTAPEPEKEKDPHTLEREARNRERLQREQQRREQAKSGNRRDSRQERAGAGRRINYKYEDEL
ncbi:hypothetical protein N7504_011980 [Penicillium tannophilum]|nr:hypothetical protein N7504_011980 [Penicillium tannophilum]